MPGADRFIKTVETVIVLSLPLSVTHIQHVFVAVLKNLVLIPVRISPDDTEKELDELYEVFLFVKDKWKTDVSRSTS